MMHSLSAQQILRIWEIGLGQHPVDRALTILATALPELPRDGLLSLSVGRRDAHLLDIRAWTFGTYLASCNECPNCQEQLEFAFDVDDIRTETNSVGMQQEYELTCDGCELHYRLPTSLDLAAITVCPDVTTAHKLLVRRCVLQVVQDSKEVAPGYLDQEIQALSETIVAALATHMAACDPMADIEIDLTCPACGHHWSVIFDIVMFLWTEICIHAKRLLREVHTLAWAYGWHEADILALSAARRQLYLEMVT